MRSVVLVCALLGVARADEDPDSRFAAAIALESTNLEAAAGALHELGSSDAAIAPDALAESCAIYDARLFDLATARACWQELATRFPASRAVTRARTRVDALAIVEAVTPADREALSAFERIVDGTPRPALRDGLRALLVAHPALPVQSRAHAWLAQADERAGDLDDALAEDELAQGGRDTWSARALRAEAELLVHRGRLDAAAAAYDRLARVDEPVSQLAVAEGRHAVLVARRLRLVTYAAWAWLALFLVAAVALARRALWPPPREVRFLAPLALLFIGGAAFEQRNIVLSVATIALGSVAIGWLAGAARRMTVALAASVAVLALAFLAAQGNDLLALVVETMRAGPER